MNKINLLKTNKIFYVFYTLGLVFFSLSLFSIELKTDYPNNEFNTDYYIELGQNKLNSGNYNSALYYFKKALKKSKYQNNKVSSAAKIHNNIAIVYDELLKFDKAKKHVFKSINYSKKTGNFDLLKESYVILGSIFLGERNYYRALSTFYHLLLVENSQTNPKSYSNILNNIGIIYYAWGDYELAKNYYLRAYDIKTELRDTTELIGIAINLGSLYLSEFQADSANYYYDIAIDMTLKSGNQKRYISTQNNKAYLKIMQEKFHEAIEIYNEIIHLASNDENLINYMYINRNLGESHLRIHNYNKAYYHINKAIEICNSTGFSDPLIALYSLKSEVLEAQENFAEAIKYHKLSTELSDSIYTIEMQKQLYEYQTNYEIQLKEEQIKLKNLELKQQKNKIQSQRAYFLISFLVLILIMLFSWIIYRNKSKLKTKSFEKKILEFQQMALSAQLNPHFISNSLNSIQRFYLTNDIEKASDYLSDFGSLVRTTLEYSTKKMVSVNEEIKYIKYYLILEQLRLENKFEFYIHIDSKIDANKCFLPPLILQPFVENAIWHGVSSLDNNIKGLIKLKFYTEADYICVIIDDNGIGIEKSMELKKLYNNKRKSYSLNINNQRLKLIQKILNKEIFFEIFDKKKNNQEGTKVIIKIPNNFAILAE